MTELTKIENALGKLDTRVENLQAQVGRVETKLGEVEKEVQGHGKWMHTLKAFAGVIVVVLGWVIVYAVLLWVKAQLSHGAHP